MITEGMAGLKDNRVKGSIPPGELPSVVKPKDPTDPDVRSRNYPGRIATAEPGEAELPAVVTTADLTTRRGCHHLYNMLLAKKGSDTRIGFGSSEKDIAKARRTIIKMYHPDRWRTDSDKATFFMQKINSAWEFLSEENEE